MLLRPFFFREKPMKNFIKTLADKVINGGSLSYEQAKKLLSLADDNFSSFLTTANRIRTHFRKDKVNLCSITNAKSGACVLNMGQLKKSCFRKRLPHIQIRPYPSFT